MLDERRDPLLSYTPIRTRTTEILLTLQFHYSEWTDDSQNSIVQNGGTCQGISSINLLPGMQYALFNTKLCMADPLYALFHIQVECATTVGSNGVWFASGNSYSAQVTVVQCMTHCLLILECFTVESSRIMTIISVLDSSVPTSHPSSLSRDSALHPHSSDLDISTVWMGMQCGK